MQSLKINSIKIKNRLFLSPMVDVTDLPYRLVCKKAGAAMTYTEMLYADAITHENDKTKKLMETIKEESPVGIQITGNKIEEIKACLPYLKEYDLVDINCGCPSIRIVGSKAGSFLLKNPEKIAEMIKILKSAGLTVTAKIRLGFDNNSVLSIAKIIEKAGADALTIHARLATHSNKIPADWTWIAKAKKELKIPVIGNGDVTNPKQAEEMLKIADGVMIARAAIGDPDIFARCISYMKTGEIIEKSFKRNLPYLKLYIKYCKKYKFNQLHRIRNIVGNFFSGFPGAAKLRQELQSLSSMKEIEEMIKKIEIV